jgi:hypothetical protein
MNRIDSRCGVGTAAFLKGQIQPPGLIVGYYLNARLKKPAYVCGPICDPFYP